MSLQDLIHQFLPERVHAIAERFTISEEFIKSMPDTIVMILESKSLASDQDKQGWFDLLPLMNEEQMSKLQGILTREKEKLQEIEEKYEQKKNDIKQRYMQKWEEGQYMEHMQTLKTKESSHQEKADQEAEDLLTQL